MAFFVSQRREQQGDAPFFAMNCTEMVDQHFQVLAMYIHPALLFGQVRKTEPLTV